MNRTCLFNGIIKRFVCISKLIFFSFFRSEKSAKSENSWSNAMNRVTTSNSYIPRPKGYTKNDDHANIFNTFFGNSDSTQKPESKPFNSSRSSSVYGNKSDQNKAKGSSFPDFLFCYHYY